MIDISDEKIVESVLNSLKKWQGAGLKIVRKNFSPQLSDDRSAKTLDLSCYKIESFATIDGVEYQRRIRDEW
jgi:hypothetical protein